MTYLSSENGRSQNNRRYSIRYIFILKKLDGYGNPLVVLFSFLCFLTFRIFGVLLEMNKCKKKILLVIGHLVLPPAPRNKCVEVLTPGTSECASDGAFKEVTRVKLGHMGRP